MQSIFSQDMFMVRSPLWVFVAFTPAVSLRTKEWPSAVKVNAYIHGLALTPLCMEDRKKFHQLDFSKDG